MNGNLPYAASRNFQITCMNYIDNKKEFLFFLKIAVVKETMRKMKKISSIVYEMLEGSLVCILWTLVVYL